jgi:hypothetical protein
VENGLNDDADIDDNTDVIYAGGEGIQLRPPPPSSLLLSLPPTSSNFENDHLLLDDDEDEDGSDDDEPPPPCQLHDDILVGDDGRNDDQ